MSRAQASAAAGTAAFALAGALAGEDVLGLARLAVAGLALGGAAAVDLRDRRIPNRLVLPAIAACAALLALEGPGSATAVALAVAAALVALAAWRPHAFGMGDAKLVLVVAVGLGDDAVGALLFGFVLAAILGLFLLRRRDRTLPFAPPLAAGALAAALF